MRTTPRRLLAGAAAAGALAVVGPVSGAEAAIAPPVGLGLPPVAAATGLGVPFAPGANVGWGGCAGTNRPSVGGNTGSTSAQTCSAVLVFNGPQIGQLSAVMGPTIIGSTVTGQVNVSAGSLSGFVP